MANAVIPTNDPVARPSAIMLTLPSESVGVLGLTLVIVNTKGADASGEEPTSASSTFTVKK